MEKCLDLHTKKASEIFGVPFEQVTPEQRKAAKQQNFREMYSEMGRLQCELLTKDSNNEQSQ